MGNSTSSSLPASGPTPVMAPPYPSLPGQGMTTVGTDADSSVDPAYAYWNDATVSIDEVAPNGFPAWPTDQRLLRYLTKATATQRPVYMNMKLAYDSAIANLKALAADQDAWWLSHNTVHQANLSALGALRDQQMAAGDADGARLADELAAAAADYKAQLDAYAKQIADNETAQGNAETAHGTAVTTTDAKLCKRMREIKGTVDAQNASMAGLLGRGFLDGTGLSPPSTRAPDSCYVPPKYPPYTTWAELSEAGSYQGEDPPDPVAHAAAIAETHMYQRFLKENPQYMSNTDGFPAFIARIRQIQRLEPPQ